MSTAHSRQDSKQLNALSTTDKKEEEEEVEALGGVSRLMKEYGEGLTLYGWLGAIGAILNGATMPAFFLFFGDLINVGSESSLDLKKDALTLMLKFFAVGFGFFIFNTMQYICWGYYGAKISVAVRKSYFKVLLNQEVGYYDEKNSGALNTALISDCLKISGMGSAIGLMLQHFVTFVAGFVLAFYYSWRLSLALMAVVPLFVVVGIISAYFEKQGTAGGASHGVGDDNDDKKADPTELAGLFSNEVLISIRSVKAIPILLASKLKEYEQKLEDIVPYVKKRSLGIGLSLGGMFFAFLGAMYSIGYWYGGKLVDNGTIEIGDMYLCMFALPIGAMSLGQLGTANADIVKARNAANKFFSLKDRKPNIKAPENKKESRSERLKGDITFNKVSFRYPTAPDTIVLDELSFEIESGKTLAIVGPSGSGKSTVINLLERYYDPSGGEILIDGQVIHNYDIEYLRKQIGFVSQTPLLFAESIKENIRGGNPNISEDDIIAAAKMADAHNFIMQLTEKYETNVGEMGNRLSGGQKQRIAIARAIVSNPSILLLDEATSALDTKSEREVQKAIDNISSTHSKTIVVIAHRLSTIKNADKIIVLVDGEIEEKGNHESLIASNGVYAALVREQQVTDITSNDDIDNPPSYDNIQQEQKISVDTYNNPKTEENKTLTGRTNDVTVEINDNNDNKKKKDDDKKEEDKIPDMGGTNRLNREYAKQFKCLWISAAIFACLNGVLWPISYGWFFPEIITMLSEEIHCEADALTLSDCHTSFEKASLKLAMYWLAIGVYALIVNIVQSYLFGIYGVRLSNMVKLDWFKSMLNQDINFHNEKTSSLLNANLTVETQSIADGMGWKYGLLLQSVVQLIIGFAIAFYRSWRVTLVFLGLTPLLVIAGALQTLIWMGTSGGNSDPFLDSGIVSQEILTNIRTVLAFPYLIVTKTETFVSKLNDGLPIATKRSAVSGFSMGINLLIGQGIIYGLGMYAGLRFADKGWVQFDDVMGAFFGVFVGGMAIGQAGSVFSALNAAKLAANKFYVTKERVAEIKTFDKNTVDAPIQLKEALKGSIEFKNLSFAYKTNADTLVLKDISFKVESGTTCAIVGPSGSGKSTIVSLLERFYDPTNGNILIDNSEIHNYDISYLRSQIGLVSQMPLLFDTSIYDNIRGGNDNCSENDIIEAAKQANAHDFILKLENKYKTLVGELGNKLSGGQRQRIAIARALLNKPSILLLDEATSALDSISEKEVQDAIDKISQNGNQTIISIAHRLSTIKNSNLIIVLVDGQIREYGNHHELMDNNGVYNALVNAQQLVEQKKQIHVRRRSSVNINIPNDIIKEEEQQEGQDTNV